MSSLGSCKPLNLACDEIDVSALDVSFALLYQIHPYFEQTVGQLFRTLYPNASDGGFMLATTNARCACQCRILTLSLSHIRSSALRDGLHLLAEFQCRNCLKVF